MKTTGQIVPLERSEMTNINGGGFAYDVGRILRFIGISGGSGVGTTLAILDWQINSELNQQSN